MEICGKHQLRKDSWELTIEEETLALRVDLQSGRSGSTNEDPHLSWKVKLLLV